MKRTILLIAAFIAANAFGQSKEQPKQYYVLADLQTWNNMLEALTVSQAPSVEVTKLKNQITSFVNHQLQEEKKVADSLAALKDTKGIIPKVK